MFVDNKTTNFSVAWTNLLARGTQSLGVIPHFDRIHSFVTCVSNLLRYEPRCHFSIDPDDKSLLLFNYENENGIVGYFFFLHFFIAWLISFWGTPLFIYSLFAGYRWYPIVYTLVVLFTYSPIPRHFEPLRLWTFLNVPKYFKSASYRVLTPEKWPELEHIRSLLNQSKQARSNARNKPLPADHNLVDSNSWHVTNLVRQMSKVKAPPRIWVCHPHGVLATGWGLQAFNPYLVTQDCVSTILYLTPPIICYTSMLGNPASVRASEIKNHLKNGRSISIIIGGFEEATIHPNKGDRLYLKARKGIFKYALQYGAELVPMFNFGETMSYSNVQGNWNLRLWLNSWSIPAMLPHGRKIFFWMPKPKMCHIVIGTPIPVQQNKSPSHEDIMTLQKSYIAKLTELYDQYKKKFYGPDYELNLEFWDC